MKNYIEYFENGNGFSKIKDYLLTNHKDVKTTGSEIEYIKSLIQNEDIQKFFKKLKYNILYDTPTKEAYVALDKMASDPEFSPNNARNYAVLTQRRGAMYPSFKFLF